MLQIHICQCNVPIDVILHSTQDDWQNHIDSRSTPISFGHTGNEPHRITAEPTRRDDHEQADWVLGLAVGHNHVWIAAFETAGIVAFAWGFELVLIELASGNSQYEHFGGPILETLCVPSTQSIAVIFDDLVVVYNSSTRSLTRHPVDQMVNWKLEGDVLTYQQLDGTNCHLCIQ